MQRVDVGCWTYDSAADIIVGRGSLRIEGWPIVAMMTAEEAGNRRRWHSLSFMFINHVALRLISHREIQIHVSLAVFGEWVSV